MLTKGECEMKITRLFVMLAFVIVVALISLVLPRANGAGAALGNSGVPVHCSHKNALPNSVVTALNCFAADGTVFVNGTTVPTGYYLMVTDVVLNCSYGSASTVQLNNASSTGAFDTWLLISHPAAGPTTHLSFVTPYLVLSAGHRLDAVLFINTPCFIGASGLLVTNATYLPSVSR
jgi:hypothetical protein